MMSSPPDKNDNDPQQLHAAADKMSIASVLNDDSQDQHKQTECQRIQPDDAQSKDEGMETGDSTEDAASEATSKGSIGQVMQTRKRRRRRSPCKKYEPEQAYFIWYHRTDLEEDWDDVEREFHRQFGEVRKKAGLQCKFYRVLGEERVEKVREQAKSGHRMRGDKIGKFGVVQRTTKRFPWMRPEDQLRSPLPCFASPRGCGSPTCVTCSRNKGA